MASKTPKIAHITTVHHPLDPRIYFKQCRSLAREGYVVYYLAPEAKGYVEEGDITPVTLKKRKNRLFRMLFSTIEAYKKTKEIKCDIVHIHDPELLWVAWILHKQNVKIIFDIHEDYESSILQKGYLPKYLRKVLAKVYKKIEKIFIKSFHLILAEKYYKEKYPSGQCILNYPLIKYEPEQIRSVPNTAEKNLIYTGNITINRGALNHSIVPLIKSELKVYLYGKCNEDLAKKMIEKSGSASNNLIIKGIGEFVSKELIDEAYISKQWLAGLALFPEDEHYKKKELTKFFEYMQHGIPIICSNFTVWKEFINQHQCGLVVDPNNKNQIKQAIEYLINNPEEAYEMGINGKNAVMNELNWKTEENKLFDFYKQILINDVVLKK
ncbi:glycosyltransferase [Bacillus sp. A116_S68]|nr:glycosyltransferase [Bacillus sp. A116_S68]